MRNQRLWSMRLLAHKKSMMNDILSSKRWISLAISWKLTQWCWCFQNMDEREKGKVAQGCCNNLQLTIFCKNLENNAKLQGEHHQTFHPTATSIDTQNSAAGCFEITNEIKFAANDTAYSSRLKRWNQQILAEVCVYWNKDKFVKQWQWMIQSLEFKWDLFCAMLKWSVIFNHQTHEPNLQAYPSIYPKGTTDRTFDYI